MNRPAESESSSLDAPAASGRGGNPKRKGPRSARSAASSLLARHARRFPDLLPDEPEVEHLDPRDAALAHAISDAAVRHWLTLSFLLDSFLQKPLASSEPKIAGALLCGAAQIVYLDRVPAHAAIDEAVTIARRVAGNRASGMVNAVLRKLADAVGETAEGPWSGQRDAIPLSSGSVRPLIGVQLPSNEIARLSATASAPVPLLESWNAKFGFEATQIQALHTLVKPPTILNVQHATAAVDNTEPHGINGSAIWAGTDRGSLGGVLRDRPEIWVQDPSSSAAVRSVTDLTPSCVLDLCAGVGTKTRQLAETFPEATVLATDKDTDRVATLTAATAHLDRVEVLKYRGLLPDHAGRADLVLLDVPCSNLGVLARRSEAKYRVGAKVGREQLDRLRAAQRQIVVDAIPLLAEGGSILYATCSIDTRENEAICEWAAKQHGFQIERVRTDLPQGVPGGDPAQYCDGAFSALLTR